MGGILDEKTFLVGKLKNCNQCPPTTQQCKQNSAHIHKETDDRRIIQELLEMFLDAPQPWPLY